MSKYQRLADHLSGHTAREWRGSFTDVEQVLGAPLPKTARSGVAWWANDETKAQAKAWLAAGWQVMDVDPKAGTVAFLKTEAAKPARRKAAPKAAAPKAAAPRKAAPEKAALEQSSPAKAAPQPEPQPEPAPELAARPSADGEPAFLQRLPGGNKTAVAGGIAAAVLGVGALIARAILRKR